MLIEEKAMNKILLAFKCFFRIFTDIHFAEHITGLFAKKQIIQKKSKEESIPDAARILGLLQRDARFIDFLQEKLDSYSDGQIGAVARKLHEKCRKILDNYITIEAVLQEEEGKEVTIEKGFNPSMIRPVGNVTGEPPFKGTLRHHGWKISRLKLPDLPEGQDPFII